MLCMQAGQVLPWTVERLNGDLGAFVAPVPRPLRYRSAYLPAREFTSAQDFRLQDHLKPGMMIKVQLVGGTMGSWIWMKGIIKLVFVVAVVVWAWE